MMVKFQVGFLFYSEYVSKVEDVVDQIFCNSKYVLFYFVWFCLILMFFEDGFWMWFQWDEQCDYMDQMWYCGYVFGIIFVFYNLVLQLVGCVMVFFRQKVEIVVGMLFFVIVV